MFEFFIKVNKQIQDFIRTLSPMKRFAVLFTGISVLIAFVSLFFWAGSSDYQILGTNLAAEDATSIMRLLREKRIPFKVENDGKTIKIPPDLVYDLRLELATMGMPQTGVVGYEVFDKQSFGTTSFVQRLNEKRAKEGELMRTINNLKGVKRSRVHLALPAHSTFVEDHKKATASVVLEIEPGVQISEKQLNGIAHLISSAIEGMETNDVTIVDGNGKLLSKNTNDPLATQTAFMIEFQQKQENDYEQKIQDILSKVVGEGKVIAKVSLDMDFSQQSETSTSYDAEGSAVKSEQKENQVMDGSRPVPMGPPGVASNTPGPAPASVTPEVRSNTQKGFETRNFAVPETIRKVIKPVGSIKKMSVAVLLDGLYQRDPASKDENSPAVFQKWSDEKLAEFKSIIASSVSLDPKRGDTIEVKNMEFQKADLNEAEKQIAAQEKKKMIVSLVQYLVIGIIIALFFFFVVKPFVTWLTDNTVENMESFLPKTIEELEKVQAQETELGHLEEAIPVIVDKVDPEKVEGEMIKEKVVTLIENNPQKAAMILHEWVHRLPTAPAVNAIKQDKAAAVGK